LVIGLKKKRRNGDYYDVMSRWLMKMFIEPVTATV
jgi:hypothetical protein